MAQGGGAADGAFLGAGFGLASAFGAQQAQAQQAQARQVPPPQQVRSGPVCASCQAANPEGAKFCMGCGQRLAPTVQHCTECGTELSATAHFCSGCGTRVGG